MVPSWAVGSYSSGPPAGGTPQILVDKTSPMTGRLRVYNREHGPDLDGADGGRRGDASGGRRRCDGERSPGERGRS